MSNINVLNSTPDKLRKNPTQQNRDWVHLCGSLWDRSIQSSSRNLPLSP